MMVDCHCWPSFDVCHGSQEDTEAKDEAKDGEAKDEAKDGEAKDGEAKDDETKDGETKDGEGANNNRKLTSKEKVQKALKAGRFKGWSWWWQFASFVSIK